MRPTGELGMLLAQLRGFLAAVVEALFSDNRVSTGWLAIRAACLVGFERLYIAVCVVAAALWYMIVGIWYVAAVLGYVLVMTALADTILGLGIFD